MKRPTVNLTTIERLGRVVIGLAAAVAGVVLLASGAGTWAAIAETLLLLTGLDLAVTGALGHCPLYKKLGYTPPSLRRAG